MQDFWKRSKKIKIEKNNIVKIYLCGPTVYDEIHIGNVRPSFFIDVLIRSLRKRNIPYKYVQNITDVDDKIIEKSKIEGRTESQISNFYKKSYLENLKKLNILKPKFYLVTKNIEKIINFIQKIINVNDGYLSEKNIFFNLKNKSEYGKLSGQKIDKLSNEKSRGVNNINFKKLNREDFTLWKETEKGINWKNPWMNKGRPGWHTECAALVDNIFKSETIDIHAGGKDLMFPHHENERIQFLSVNKKEMCKNWIHFGYVNFSNQKMSKSLKNTIKVSDYLKKYSENSLRILLLNNKYKEDIDLDESKITQAESISKKIINTNKKIKIFLFVKKLNLKIDRKEKKFEKIVTNHIIENLDTTKIFFELEKEINFINKKNLDIFSKESNEKDKELIDSLKRFYLMCEVLGINLNSRKYSQKIKEKIEKWINLTKKKDFERSDKVRISLQKNAII